MLKKLAAKTLLIAFTASPSYALPPHRIVDNSFLPNGRRIQINVTDPNLSKADCVKLIDKYYKLGAPKGQVSVHKPHPDPIWEGKILGFCVNNYDSQGTFFTTFFR